MCCIYRDRGRGPGTRRPRERVGEAGEGVPGPGGREEGWGRPGKESWDQGAGGGVGEAGEGARDPKPGSHTDPMLKID